MRKNNVKRTMDSDLLTSMFTSFIGTHILDDFIVFFADAQIAVVLGRLTDAVFTHDVAYLKTNILQIMLCLAFRIVCEPLLFAFFSSRSVLGSCNFTRKLLSHYLHKPYADISQNQAGDIPSRVDNDIMDFVREKLKQTADIILLPIFTVYLLAVFSRYNLNFAAVSLAAVAVTYAAPIIARKRLAKYDLAEREYRSSMNTAETELASNSWRLQAMKLDGRLTANMQVLFDSFFKGTHLKRLRCNTVVDIISSVCRISVQIIIIITGSFLLCADKIQFGEIAAMLSLTGSVTFLFDKASGLITVRPILQNLYNRLLFFYDGSKAPIGEDTVEACSDVGDNIVEGKNVTAEYDGKTVLKNLSFEIPRNKITLIKGANGSGKSTLVSMICGFEQPSSGKILLNGCEQKDINSRIISLSAQSSVLFRYVGLRENILLGCFEKEDAPRADELIKAFSLDCAEDISSVENLSGGEAQKTKILRALMKDAELLILDEPENNLDKDAVRYLVQELKNARKTVLIVSHFHSFDEIAEHIVKI